MIIKCKYCGSDIQFNGDESLRRCENCGLINMVSELQEDKPDPERQEAAENIKNMIDVVFQTVIQDKAYRDAADIENRAAVGSEFLAAARKYDAAGDYKDAKERAAVCRLRVEGMREALYNDAVRLMDAAGEDSNLWQAALAQLESSDLADYRDVAMLKDRAKRQYEKCLKKNKREAEPVADNRNGKAANKAAPEQLKAWSTVTFGRYEQDNNLGNGKEDIEWIVLDVQGNKALLISKYGLDAKPYNEKMADTTWENSTLRKWLNNDFMMEAFTEAEQGAILLTEVDNSQIQGCGKWSTDGGNNTRDKLFLLSDHEAFDLYFKSDSARAVKVTAYAKAQGASVDDSSGSSLWWLRSPGDYQNRAASVNTDGSRDSDIAGRPNDAVRPALWIDLMNLRPLEKEKKEAEPAADNRNGKAANKAAPEQLKAWSTVTFGRYEQDNNTGNGKEAIEWIVLDVRGDKALLISKYGLDAKKYNEKGTSVTWETCTLRKWLNNEFMNAAFSTAEQGSILLTEVDNSKSQGYSGYNTSGGNNTRDKLFLLSAHEAFDLYFTSDSARTVNATAYAKAQGAYVDSDNSSSCWWLRSPGIATFYAAFVFPDGSRGDYHVEDDFRVVRPALWIDLASEIF